MSRRVAVALAAFAGGAAAVHHHHDRPTLPAAPAAVAPDMPQLIEHPSRSWRRPPLAVPHPTRVRHGRWHLATVTAYCATGHRTAGGVWPRVGMAAGNAWALGTRIRIRGYRSVVITDRSAPGATDVDLYLGSGASCATAAVRFGRRQLLVAEATR